MENPPDTFKCYLISWDEVYRLAKISAFKIKNSGFKPDLVIGIARGGLVPARIVCDFLLPMTHGEIRKALKSNFDISISKKDLMEMLNDMHAIGKIRKIEKVVRMKWAF